MARIDGPLKVCGAAEFPGDVMLANMAHAALAVSPIARGRITAIPRASALATPGMLLILTHEDLGKAIAPVKAGQGAGDRPFSRRHFGSKLALPPAGIPAAPPPRPAWPMRSARHAPRFSSAPRARVKCAWTIPDGADGTVLKQLRGGQPHDCVGRLLDDGFGNVVEPNVADRLQVPAAGMRTS
jgi:hypothetical protein